MHTNSWTWPGGTPAQGRMFELIFGHLISQVVRSVVDLSLADHLADGPLTATEIAAREHSDPHTTLRLMRVAVALDLLTAGADDAFHGTALLATLRSDSPDSLRGMSIGLSSRVHWLPWSKLHASVRTGESQGTAALGASAFEFLGDNPDDAADFTAFMEAITRLWGFDAAQVIDTSQTHTAVDVGGANGALVRGLKATNPRLRAILFDRPDVAAQVAHELRHAEHPDPIEVVGGDFFTAVPAGDLLLLKFVLHDWDDEHAVQILRRCTAALVPGGRIAIIEMLVGESSHPGIAALMDLNMLAVAGGRERSLAEFDVLLTKAGLRRISLRAIPNSPQYVIEAAL